MQFTMILQLCIHSLSMDQLLNGWLAELHTILDSFLTDVANTTNTPLGVVDGGWMGTTKWWAKVTSTLKTAKWHPLITFPTPHTIQSSLIRDHTYQPVIWWFTAGHQLVQGRWSHLKTTQVLVDIWKAWETSHSKCSLGNCQHQCLPESLVNIYSYVSCDGEMYALLLCAWKAAFLKYSHISKLTTSMLILKCIFALVDNKELC